MKTQAAIGLDLTIWNVTDPHSVHDLTVLCNSSLKNLLSQERKGLGDTAYIGEANVVTPHRKPRGRELTQKQLLFDKQVSHVRIAVENAFRRVKDFKIISDTYRGDYHKLEEFNCIFKLVCALVNLSFRKHPLRREMRTAKKLPDSIDL